MPARPFPSAYLVPAMACWGLGTVLSKYAVGLVGLSRIDASVSVVLWATEPLLIVALALLILKERIGLRTAVLLAVAMTGVVLIVGTPTGSAPIVGVMLTLAAVSACALYSVLLRRLHLTDGTVPIVVLQQSAALAFALLIFAIAIAADGTEQPATSAPTPHTWMVFLIRGCLGCLRTLFSPRYPSPLRRRRSPRNGRG